MTMAFGDKVATIGGRKAPQNITVLAGPGASSSPSPGGDYLTRLLADALYAPVAHTHPWSAITSKPTTLAGYGITDAQPASAELTAIAGLSSPGYIKRTGPGTYVAVASIPVADVSGLTGWATKAFTNGSTTDVAEGTRLYYTDARARTALSATSPLSYNSSTGVISHLATDGNLHVPATGTGNNGRFLQAGATSGSLAWIQVTPALIGAAPGHSVAANYVLKSDGAGGFAASNITDTGSQVSISGRFTAPAYATTSGTPPILFGQNYTSISDIACVGIGVPAANSSGLTRPLVIRRGNTPLFVVDDMGNTNVYGALVVSGLLQFSSLGAGFLKSNSSGIISVDGTVYATVSSLSNYLSKTAGGVVSGYTSFSSGLAATAGISVTGTAVINAGGQLLVSKDSTPTTSFNTLYSQAPIVVNRVTTSGTSTVAGIGFHNSGGNAALLYYDAATSVFKYNRETANGIVTIWDSSSLSVSGAANQLAFFTGANSVSSDIGLTRSIAGGVTNAVIVGHGALAAETAFVIQNDGTMDRDINFKNANLTTWSVRTTGISDNWVLRAHGIDDPITVARAGGGAITFSRPLYVGGGVLKAYDSGHLGIYGDSAPGGVGNYSFVAARTGAYSWINGTISSGLAVGALGIALATSTGLAVTGTFSATSTLAWGGGPAIGSSNNVVQGENSTRTFDTDAWTSALPSGFYQSDSAGTTPSGGWCHMIAGRYTDTGSNYQSQIATDFWNDRVWFRRIENGSVKSWRELWHSGNMVNDGPWLPLAGNKTVTGLATFGGGLTVPQSAIVRFGTSEVHRESTYVGLWGLGVPWQFSRNATVYSSSNAVSASFNEGIDCLQTSWFSTLRVSSSFYPSSQTHNATSNFTLPVLAVGEFRVLHFSSSACSVFANSTQTVNYRSFTIGDIRTANINARVDAVGAFGIGSSTQVQTAILICRDANSVTLIV